MSYEVFGDNDAFDDDWPEKAAEAGWYSPDDLSRAEKDVIRERARQVDLEGFDLAHDDKHVKGELAAAAVCYVLQFCKKLKMGQLVDVTNTLWPFGPKWFKPDLTRRDLVRATALLIAEIERLDRVSAETKGA